MFGKNRKKTPGAIAPEKFDTIIGPNTEVKGDISVSESIRIDGHLSGNVTGTNKAPVTVVVGAHGEVQGNVTALRVVVAGKVHGCILAQEEVELHSDCVVEGDVSCGSISIAHGAKILGRLSSSHDQTTLLALEPSASPTPELGHKKKVELVA